MFCNFKKRLFCFLSDEQPLYLFFLHSVIRYLPDSVLFLMFCSPLLSVQVSAHVSNDAQKSKPKVSSYFINYVILIIVLNVK